MTFMLTPSLIQILLEDTSKTPRSSCHLMRAHCYATHYATNDQPTAVSQHFTLPAHSMDNIELVPLELITSNRDSNQGKRSVSNHQGQNP